MLRLAGSEVLLSLTRPTEGGAPSDSSDSDSTSSASETRLTPELGQNSEPDSPSRAGLRLPLDTENYGVSQRCWSQRE